MKINIGRHSNMLLVLFVAQILFFSCKKDKDKPAFQTIEETDKAMLRYALAEIEHIFKICQITAYLYPDDGEAPDWLGPVSVTKFVEYPDGVNAKITHTLDFGTGIKGMDGITRSGKLTLFTQKRGIKQTEHSVISGDCKEDGIPMACDFSYFSTPEGSDGSGFQVTNNIYFGWQKDITTLEGEKYRLIVSFNSWFGKRPHKSNPASQNLPKCGFQYQLGRTNKFGEADVAQINLELGGKGETPFQLTNACSNTWLKGMNPVFTYRLGKDVNNYSETTATISPDCSRKMVYEGGEVAW